MAPVKPGRYEFDFGSIVVLRTRLKMKQTKMAELLGVPANTLSRWEKGATKPDAESLAAIHSIAIENGASVNFFKKATREQVAIFFDVQNNGVSKIKFAAFNKSLRKEVEDRFPNAKRRRFRAFVSSGANLDIFESNQWSVDEGIGNRDVDITKAIRDYCQSDAKRKAVVLMTKDGDFAGIIKEIQNKGVQVYLMAPANPSKKLLDVVDKKRRIPWPA